MRRLPSFLVSCIFLVVIAACGNTKANNGTGATGGTDTAGGDLQTNEDGTQNDVTTGTDGAANDTGSQEIEGTDATSSTDVIDENANGSDGADLDISDVSDTSVDLDIDVTSQDGGDFDIAIDVPDVPPGSCSTDKECAALSFSPCQIGFCSNGMCKVKAAVDGVTCATGGSCGGPGVCKKGACDAPSTCQPDVCSPLELSCGSKLVIELASLGTSKFNGYGSCSSSQWKGPEVAILLTNDVTTTATLSIDTTGVNVDYEVFDIRPTLDGKCDTMACDDSSSYSLTIGLPTGVPRIVMLDTSAPDTGSITLTMDCTTTVICGDGTCDSPEACSSCPKDCGKCEIVGACGDGTCGAGEDCALCPGDCGVCDAACEINYNVAGCGGCACEDCVCNQPTKNYPNGDKYCCTSAWDSSCVTECKTCGAKCPTVSVCGDGDCNYTTEDEKTCPEDCAYYYCGDGACNPGSAEDCTSCTQDCGFCMMSNAPVAGCGNGKCDGDENCTNCSADCGTCGDYSCACLADPTCCTESFGYFCQDECNTCIAANGGGSCPVSNCGDGICAGETCGSCAEDCGECPAYCGDGKCDSGEDLANCAKDCTPGCNTSSEPTCNGCACESCVCAQDSYCCNFSWDSKCVGECKTCGTKCP